MNSFWFFFLVTASFTQLNHGSLIDGSMIFRRTTKISFSPTSRRTCVCRVKKMTYPRNTDFDSALQLESDMEDIAKKIFSDPDNNTLPETPSNDSDAKQNEIDVQEAVGSKENKEMDELAEILFPNGTETNEIPPEPSKVPSSDNEIGPLDPSKVPSSGNEISPLEPTQPTPKNDEKPPESCQPPTSNKLPVTNNNNNKHFIILPFSRTVSSNLTRDMLPARSENTQLFLKHPKVVRRRTFTWPGSKLSVTYFGYPGVLRRGGAQTIWRISNYTMTLIRKRLYDDSPGLLQRFLYAWKKLLFPYNKEPITKAMTVGERTWLEQTNVKLIKKRIREQIRRHTFIWPGTKVTVTYYGNTKYEDFEYVGNMWASVTASLSDAKHRVLVPDEN